MKIVVWIPSSIFMCVCVCSCPSSCSLYFLPFDQSTLFFGKSTIPQIMPILGAIGTVVFRACTGVMSHFPTVATCFSFPRSGGLWSINRRKIIFVWLLLVQEPFFPSRRVYLNHTLWYSRWRMRLGRNSNFNRCIGCKGFCRVFISFIAHQVNWGALFYVAHAAHFVDRLAGEWGEVLSFENRRKETVMIIYVPG